jgi:plasmid stabilization system protein ParE
MARSLRWSDRALDELDAVLAHIATDAPRNAAAVHDRMVARLASLADQPGQGRHVPEYQGDLSLREVIVQSWRIIYRVTEAEVVIVAVVHSARLLRNVPPL